MSFYLAFYDVTGIQNYIFMSPTLKDNVGASYLVQETLTKFLYKAIELAVVSDNFDTDWENATTFQIGKPASSCKAEVIYSGGGNALVAFADNQTAINTNTHLSKLIMENALGLNFISVIKIVNGDGFYKDYTSLINEINNKKISSPPNYKLLGISIDELCTQTYLPLCQEKSIDGAYLPKEIALKRQAQKNMDGCLPGIVYDKERFTLPIEFDNLGSEEGESHIGIVHIDGNSMGKLIKNTMDETNDYSDAVRKMRLLSSSIKNIYIDAVNTIISRLQSNITINTGIAKINDCIRLVQDEDIKKYYLPFRPLVVNGDDVTFVCDGRLALNLAYLFLDFIESCPLTINNQLIKLSACAGVSITKTKFPFYRAYSFAEECCKNAKKRAKFFSEEEPGSWIDFQVIFGGAQINLEQHRKSNYYIVDQNIVHENDETLMYPLLWRPWFIGDKTEGEEAKYSFKNFLSIMDDMVVGKNKWPRSKLKRLRTLYFEGKNAVELFLSEVYSRNLRPPEVSNVYGNLVKSGFDNQTNTPYFDVLEMMDLWQPLNK